MPMNEVNQEEASALERQIAFQVRSSFEVWREIYKKLMEDFNNRNPIVLRLFPDGVSYGNIHRLLKAVIQDDEDIDDFDKVLTAFKSQYDSRVKWAETQGIFTSEQAEMMYDSLTGGFAYITLDFMAERNKIRPGEVNELVQEAVRNIIASFEPRPETPNSEADRGGGEEDSGDDMEVEDVQPEPEDHRKKRRM